MNQSLLLAWPADTQENWRTSRSSGKALSRYSHPETPLIDGRLIATTRPTRFQKVRHTYVWKYLKRDPRLFDASFFGISPRDAENARPSAASDVGSGLGSF
ncbi:MAG: hypothetical protein U0930_09055 [Pirellulales bacterium]